MQPNSTLKTLLCPYLKIFTTFFIYFVIAGQVRGQVLFSESFDDITTLTSGGWATQNLSSPVGTTGWYQGNPSAFSSQSGAADAYIAADFDNVSNLGTISNWLFSPNITLKNGDVLKFYTRAYDGSFPDRLQIRLSTNGASVDAGTSATSVGDFTNLLLDINPSYSSNIYPESWTEYSVVITGVPTPTSGRIAFRYFVENGGVNGFNSFYIGIDDVLYSAVTCTGTPSPGNTISTENPVCANRAFTLSLQNPGSGVSYQWQSSPDNATWSDITGGSNAIVTTSQAAATWYRCIVTCSGNSGISNPLQVTMSPQASCYCEAGASDTSPFYEKISNVSFGTINNASNLFVPYEDFTTLSTTVIKGQVLPITITAVNSYANDKVYVWIDFNQNGNFGDPGEQVFVSATGPGPYTGNITIPPTAATGVTRMRIRLDDVVYGPNSTPCGYSGYGQVEDYTVDIQPCVQGVFTVQPSNKAIQCSGSTSFSVSATGSVLSYSWQYRINAGASWQSVPNSGVYSGANTSTLVLTNVPQTFNGYQYRALLTGPCTAIDFSGTGTLTVNKLVPAVSPTAATICSGTIQQLSLTNTISEDNSVTFNATTGLPMMIPDNDANGAVNTLNVTGIPAGAIIKNISVQFNLTHTYVGDIVINLKSPNNQTLNLVGLLDNGTASNGTDNFINTVIDSLSTISISGAPAPRTGTYKADGFTATVPFLLPTTTNYWAPLFSSVNGTWTLGLCDLAFLDEGTLDSWSITITYVSPAFAAGTWTSVPASVMYTDAAATTAYVPGTPVTSVYVKPAVTTNYKVAFNTSICNSDTTTVTVKVVDPVTIITQPADEAACVGGTAAFSISASGGPVSYQWQVSTDAGATWNDINGATNAVLNLSGITTAMNNYMYHVVMTSSPCTDTVTSDPGILKVNGLPVVSISASVATLSPAQSSTVLTASSNPAASGAWSWTLDGAAITGNSNTQNVTVDGVGTYQVRVTDINGCENTSGPFVVDAEASEKLWIYPNPTTGVFQVRLYYRSDRSDVRKVSIYNMAGKVVAVKEFQVGNLTPPYMKMEFDLSGLGHGIYLVKVAQLYSVKITSGLVVIQ